MESVSRPEINESNAFAKHRLEYHQGNDTRMEIQVDVMKTFPRPMQRQVWEGVAIREVNCDVIMNSKQDHYAPAVGHMEERREVVVRAIV